jgi:hypothetical protein
MTPLSFFLMALSLWWITGLLVLTYTKIQMDSELPNPFLAFIGGFLGFIMIPICLYNLRWHKGTLKNNKT